MTSFRSHFRFEGMAHHPGPVPEVLTSALVSCLTKYGQHNGDPWCFGDYWTLTMPRGTSYEGVLGCRKLLVALHDVQKELRFKPNQLREALETAMRGVPQMTDDHLPLALHANRISRRIMVLLYHVRRSFQLDRHAAPPRGTSADSWSRFHQLLVVLGGSGAPRRPAPIVPPKARKLRQHDSVASATSSFGPSQDDDEIDDMGTWISTATAPSPDIREQAVVASLNVLPAQRGALKKLVIKRPARNIAPKANTKSFGMVKILCCTHKSYLCMEDKASGKWPLVVECSRGGHAKIISQIFEFMKTNKTTRDKVIAMRDRLQGSTQDDAHGATLSKAEEIGEEDDDHDDDDDEEDDAQQFFV